MEAPGLLNNPGAWDWSKARSVEMKFFKQKLPSMNPHVESPDPDSEAESKTRGKPAAESDIPDLRGMPRTIGYANTTQTVMAINRGLLLANLALGVACVALAIGLAQSREWITVYIPPDPVAGGFQTAGMPSAPTVYGFVAQTLQQLYHWPIDGEIDYANAIDMQTPYLTTTFRRELQADFARLRNRSGLNELRGRARALHPAPERVVFPGAGSADWPRSVGRGNRIPTGGVN